MLLKFYRSYLSPHSLMQLLFVGLMLTTLSACSGVGGAVISALNPLDNGGINANVQAGKTNTQTVGTTTVTENKADNLTQNTTNNVDIPPWVIMLLIAGWLAPSPGEIARGLINLVKGK